MTYAHENDGEKEIKKLADEIHREEEKVEELLEDVKKEKKKLEELSDELNQLEHHHKDVVGVVVITTSGSWPKHGFERVPESQQVKIFLAKAVAELKIVGTQEWVATSGGKEINPEKNYKQNDLCGEVAIDYKPRHGGGGNE